MGNFLYVCVKSEDGIDYPQKAFRSKESAMGWMRHEFLRMKEDTGLGNEDFEWGDGDNTLPDIDGRLVTWRKREVYCISSHEIALKVWEVPFDAGSLDEVFLCQTETEEWTYVSGVTSDLESAREWQRRMFLEDKHYHPDRANEYYAWDNDEPRGIWDCLYTLDRDSWTVSRIHVSD